MMISNIVGNKQVMAVVLLCCFCGVHSAGRSNRVFPEPRGPKPKNPSASELHLLPHRDNHEYVWDMYDSFNEYKPGRWATVTRNIRETVKEGVGKIILKADQRVKIAEKSFNRRLYQMQKRINVTDGERMFLVTKDSLVPQWKYTLLTRIKNDKFKKQVFYFLRLFDYSKTLLVQSDVKTKTPDLEAGTRVTLKDLKAKHNTHQYNGRTGTVVSRDKGSTWRVRVEMDGEEEKILTCIKSKNLVPMPYEYLAPCKVYTGLGKVYRYTTKLIFPPPGEKNQNEARLVELQGGKPGKNKEADLFLHFGAHKEYPDDFVQFIHAIKRNWNWLDDDKIPIRFRD